MKEEKLLLQGVKFVITVSIMVLVLLLGGLFLYFFDIHKPSSQSLEGLNCGTEPIYYPQAIVNDSDGRALFKLNCKSCHNENMVSDMTGPALAGVQSRWETTDDLYDWIRNAPALVASGHEYANQLYNEWNKLQMTTFPELSDDDIQSILLYIEVMSGQQ